MRQVEQMKEKIERTKEKISTIQSNLPSNSRLTSSSANAPSTIRCQMEQFFEQYSKERARQDYRFWMVSVYIMHTCNDEGDRIMLYR